MIKTYTSFIPVFKKILDNQKISKYLEWGPGNNSTKLIIDKIGKENVYSIEHDKGWFNKIKNACKNIYLEELVRDEMCPYVSYPRSLNTKFDFIFVDGRNRVLCVKESKNFLNKNGIILLHDIHRKKYIDGLTGLFNYEHVDYESDTALFSNDNKMEYLC